MPDPRQMRLRPDDVAEMVAKEPGRDNLQRDGWCESPEVVEVKWQAGTVFPMWVVLRTERGVAFYDEVEDEYGTAVVLEDGTLGDPFLHGELGWAVDGLAQRTRA